EPEPGPQRERGPRRGAPDARAKPLREHPDVAMTRYRVAVGRRNGVRAGNLVGAIANEGGLDSSYIGAIDIQGDYTTVDLPQELPGETLNRLRAARVCGRRLELRPFEAGPAGGGRRAKPKHRGR
ncbi:DbpA RNA binding domain-containing protein, partial [Arhodomonas sp. KWT]